MMPQGKVPWPAPRPAWGALNFVNVGSFSACIHCAETTQAKRMSARILKLLMICLHRSWFELSGRIKIRSSLLASGGRLNGRELLFGEAGRLHANTNECVLSVTKLTS